MAPVLGSIARAAAAAASDSSVSSQIMMSCVAILSIFALSAVFDHLSSEKKDDVAAAYKAKPIAIFIPFDGRGAALPPDTVVVDSTHPTAKTLTHHKASSTPELMWDDTSTGVVLNAIRARHPHVLHATHVTCNHFDIDGACSVWAVMHPAHAMAHEELLRVVARVGDMRELIAGAELELIRATGAYSFLVPPAAVLALVERGEPQSDVGRNESGLGGVFGALATAERRLLRRVDLPAGLSVLALGRKRSEVPSGGD